MASQLILISDELALKLLAEMTRGERQLELAELLERERNANLAMGELFDYKLQLHPIRAYTLGEILVQVMNDVIDFADKFGGETAKLDFMPEMKNVNRKKLLGVVGLLDLANPDELAVATESFVLRIPDEIYKIGFDAEQYVRQRLLGKGLKDLR